MCMYSVYCILYQCVLTVTARVILAGMGEVIAVLNGVEFKTRHNDPLLRSPSKTSKAYMAQDDIG